MSEFTLRISNVGGIDDLSCTFDRGITAITGSNASNKTSVLRAIAFGFGYPDVPIKTDADRARVELSDGTRTVERTARRSASGVEIEGRGWVADDEGQAEYHNDLFERFAVLLEFSDVRRAVRTGGDIESILTAPVDLETLEHERSTKIEEKRYLRERIAEAADVDDRLEETRSSLADARDRVTSLEATVDELRTKQGQAATADDAVADLRERRATLVDDRSDVQDDIEQLTAAIDRLDDRIDDTEADIEEARETVADQDVAAARTQRRDIEAELADLDDRIDILQSVLTANREMLDSSFAGVLGRDRTLVDDSLTCWACGSAVPASDFEETVAQLSTVVESDKQRRASYEPRLDDLDDRIDAAEAATHRLESLKSEKAELEARRAERAESLATRRDHLTALREELAALDGELDATAASKASEATTLATEIEESRVDLHSARSEVDALEERVADLEDQRDQRHADRERVDVLTDEIASLTDRIEHLESEIRQAFNDAMDDLLRALEFDRIERIWLDGSFDLVVARDSDGVVREDSVAHLSESERETVGIVLGLAGYVAYDMTDACPVILVDALGALDAARTVELLSYVAEDVPSLVAAVRPETAARLSDDAVGRIVPGTEDVPLQ